MDRRNALFYLFALLTAAILVSTIILFGVREVNKLTRQKAAEFAEVSRPANINITEITYFLCEACDSANKIAKELEKVSRINNYDMIDWEPFVVDNASMHAILLKKYNITRVPALIITGEFNKTGLTRFQREDAIIYEAEDAPFIDIESGEFIGDVKIANVYEAGCKQCRNETVWVKELEDAGVWIASVKFVDSTSEKGKFYIERYNLTTLPATILSRELANYSFIPYTWSKVGSIEGGQNKSEATVYVTREPIPPYFDIKEKRVTGLITAYYINDSSCSDCYDLNVYKNLFKQFYLYYNMEIFLDIPQAKDMISKYNITKVPTIVLSKEANDYEELVVSWHQVGTIEEDGSMVFRNLDGLGVRYKDIGG